MKREWVVSAGLGGPIFLLLSVSCAAVLELFLSVLLGISFGEMLMALPFRFGLFILVPMGIVLFGVPLSVTAIVLRRFSLPAIPGLIVPIVILLFGLSRSVMTSREGISLATEQHRTMDAYYDEIRRGISVQEFSFSLSRPVTEASTAHYVRQFKEAFEEATAHFKLNVRTPGHYRFELVFRGTFPKERWAEALGRNVNAADQKIEKFVDWEEQLLAGSIELHHPLPIKTWSPTASWVHEAESEVFLRIIRILTVDERLALLGTSRTAEAQALDEHLGKGTYKNSPELNPPKDRLIAEPLLELIQVTDVLPVSWMIAR